MGEKLFVIGNGFDLHHRIPSGYWDFGKYVSAVDAEVYETIKEYLSFDDDFWNCFEERLATLDHDQIIEYAANYLESYGADDWSDAYHHNYEYEIEQIVRRLSDTLRKHFASWIRQLRIPNNASPFKVRCIDRTAKFLNFNYTSTLQMVYGVPDRNILHIHGDGRLANSELVLGHGWEPQSHEKLYNQVDEDTDTRVAGGYELIDRYFSETFKPTEKIIEKNRSFFSSLNEASEVFILGHSLADVDEPYISELIKNLPLHVSWTISYYRDAESIMRNFSSYGVSPANVRYVELGKF